MDIPNEEKSVFIQLLLFANYRNSMLIILKYWKYLTTEKYKLLS